MGWLYTIPLLYFVLMIVIGVVVARKQETRSDFFVASNSMNSGVLFATIFSTVVGANTYMGFSGMVFTDGFSMTWLLVAAGSSYFLLFFISGKIREIASQYEVFTLPDIMELRYSRPVALVTTFFSLVALIGGAGGSILGVGVILNSLLGIDTTTAIVITAVVTIVYTTFGGLMGVALTDWVQSIIMVVGLLLVLVFGFHLLQPDQTVMASVTNGGQALMDAMGPEFMSFTQGATMLMVLAWAITFMPLNTISQTQIQRVYAAKSVKSVQRISLLMILFVALFTAFGLALVGGLGSAIIPDIANPETVFPMMAMEVINPVIGMIIVTGILGACMSTVDSNLLGSGIHVSRDIYERYKKGKGQQVDEKKGLKVTRITLVVIGVLSTIAAILTPSIMGLLVMTMQFFAGATFAPILFGLFWKRANSTGAMAGLLLGGGTTLVTTIIGTTTDPVIYGIIASVAGVLAGSLLTDAEVKKGEVFNFSTVKKQDLPWFFAVVVFFTAFLIGVNYLNIWPLLIIITILALAVSVVMLLIYAFPKRSGKKGKSDFTTDKPSA